ncbi:MAG TPA: GNAT family protein [Gaiellaceae bacterium]|nr:GNAT family protein [Gaiellaceae bacterium]
MNDSDVRIRPAVPSDAERLLELKLVLDRETSFMMLEPGERTETAAEVAAHLAEVDGRGNSIVLVADDGTSLLGYVEADGGRFRRNRHSAQVVIGVRQASSGRGIGQALLRELSAWAERRGVHRLELTVMAHNARAVALYEAAGYELEGTRSHSLVVDGRYVDELALAKLHDAAVV